MKKNCILIFSGWYPNDKDLLDGNFVRDQVLILQSTIEMPIVLVLASDGERNWIKDENLHYIVINHRNFIPARFGKVFLYIKKKTIQWYAQRKVEKYLRSNALHPEFGIVQSVLSNTFIHQHIISVLKLPFIIIEHYVTFHKVEDYMYKPYSNIFEIQKFVQSANKRFGVSETYSEVYSEYFKAKFKTLCNPILSIFFEIVHFYKYWWRR